MSFRGGRGRGRGRGGGGRGRQAKAVQFELFPEIQDLGTATDVSAPERKQLLRWTLFLQKYCETSPYKYTDGREISKAAEVIKSDIERYSDRVSLVKPKPTFEDVIKIDHRYMPAELVGGDKKGKRVVKRVRWNPDKAFEKLDRYEKLEQKLKEQEGDEDKEDEVEPVEENVEDGELSNDDYDQIEHFDDDEDDFNMSGDDNNDEDGVY